MYARRCFVHPFAPHARRLCVSLRMATCSSKENRRQLCASTHGVRSEFRTTRAATLPRRAFANARKAFASPLCRASTANLGVANNADERGVRPSGAEWPALCQKRRWSGTLSAQVRDQDTAERPRDKRGLPAEPEMRDADNTKEKRVAKGC